MDTSKLSQGQMIAAIGGIILIISLFLTWLSLPSPFPGASAWDAFSGMDIIMLIVGILAIGWAAVDALGASVNLPANAGWIVGVLGVLMTGWTFGYDIESSNAGIGAWLGLIGSIAIAVGGFGTAAFRTTRATPASTTSTTPTGSAPPPAA